LWCGVKGEKWHFAIAKITTGKMVPYKEIYFTRQYLATEGEKKVRRGAG